MLHNVKMDKTFLGLPMADERISIITAHAATGCGARVVCPMISSLLNFNCNRLLARALSLRKEQGFKWFAMLHADVEVGPPWLDTLIDMANQHGADMLSAVIPIKGPSGLTSTAIYNRDEGGQHMRLTLRQVNSPGFPEVFDVNGAVDALKPLVPEPLRARLVASRLLVNTGCMILRLDQPWSHTLEFCCEDAIEFVNDAWVATVLPEDWVLSLQVAQNGGKVMAAKMPCTHVGTERFPSDGTYGKAYDGEPG